ncbi:MAG: hypothetical protein K2X03_15320 [Bryobacteraceae bacterium]|nr:hypothetical protein [Bryobacteraceae bacterium]
MRSLTFVMAAAAAWAQPTVVMNQAPTRVVGQARANSQNGAPNLVEGREFYQPQSVWVDGSGSTSILYVADTRNNRVLAWRNAVAANAGSPADLVIGQRDLQSTAPQGPDRSGQGLASGLNSPMTVITDATGNLYVADCGNNRILRYPRPFAQNSELLQVDLVIGQRSINENSFNQGAGMAGMSDSSLFTFQPFGAVQRAAMAFDAQRNLWVTDPQNHRVLRFPVAALDRGGFAPSADLVLGGTEFTSSQGRSNSPFIADIATRKDYIWAPTGIAFDSRGRLFVRDWAPGFSRVLVWDVGAFFNGKPANRIVGIPTAPGPGQTLPPINEFVAGGFTQGTVDSPRPSIFVFGTNLYVPDVNSHRILIFDAFENWPAEATRVSPPARAVIGQESFGVGRANRNGLPVGGNGFNYPTAVWVGGAEMYVADTANNRILVMPGRDFTFNAASRVVGQVRFDQSGVNLVEGREFYFLDGFGSDRNAVGVAGLGGTCLAVDGDRIYVADSQNNRIVGFTDVRRVKALDFANIVIGQADLTGTVANAPSGDVNNTSERGLNAPNCVATDRDGNVWVADTGNGRVLRFPRPAEGVTGLRQPNLVLGQGSFTARSTDPTSRTMRAPTGLAFLSDGSLLVSDYVHSRVLRFRKPAGGDFQNGQAADGVFGQANFTDSVRGTTLNRFISPKGIATDSDDRLYVADVLGNRVTIFSEAGTSVSNATARQDFSGLGSPQAVYVNPQSGDIWVADTTNQRVVRLLPFSQLPVGTINPEQSIASPFPLAMALDRFGNLLTADAFNRIALYYPVIRVLNSASANRNQIAPTTYSAIYGAANAFGDVTRLFTEEPNPVPMPTVVGDTRVLVGDRPAPIQFVSPSQINFIVPRDTPTSGNVDIIVERPSTGQVLAAGFGEMDVVAPALFAGAGGRGQVAATHPDGSINSPSNPAARNTIITVYATGLGNLAGSPADGAPAPGGVVTTGTLQVIIGTTAVPAANIQYSGLTPGLISVWQINVLIPNTVPPSNTTPFGLRYRDVAAQPGLTIAVRQ